MHYDVRTLWCSTDARTSAQPLLMIFVCLPPAPSFKRDGELAIFQGKKRGFVVGIGAACLFMIHSRKFINQLPHWRLFRALVLQLQLQLHYILSQTLVRRITTMPPNAITLVFFDGISSGTMNPNRQRSPHPFPSPHPQEMCARSGFGCRGPPHAPTSSDDTSSKDSSRFDHTFGSTNVKLAFIGVAIVGLLCVSGLIGWCIWGRNGERNRRCVALRAVEKEAKREEKELNGRWEKGNVAVQVKLERNGRHWWLLSRFRKSTSAELFVSNSDDLQSITPTLNSLSGTESPHASPVPMTPREFSPASSHLDFVHDKNQVDEVAQEADGDTYHDSFTATVPVCLDFFCFHSMNLR